MHWKISALERARGFRKAWLCAIIRGMRLYRNALALLPLIALAAAPPKPAAPTPSPGEIVAQAKAEKWVTIALADLLVMELAPDAKSKPRRVVIQLIPPPFSQGWVGNIRKLAAAHWWDGLSVNRVQDNYVVQWGDADGEEKAKARKLPEGLAVVPEGEYEVNFGYCKSGQDCGVTSTQYAVRHKMPQLAAIHSRPDAYQTSTAFAGGWPVSLTVGAFLGVAPIHCYATVGVGRNLSPDTGSGAELYTVIGHAPRHLDRNIAVVGRVIDGIEHLSSLPRGTGALGFYETAEERVPIRSVRLGSEVSGLPSYQYLSTESQTFARYADARANRRDAFFIRPAGGADICNIPVPVRKVKASN
jgi:peptidylprolyl isomerase